MSIKNIKGKMSNETPFKRHYHKKTLKFKSYEYDEKKKNIDNA